MAKSKSLSPGEEYILKKFSVPKGKKITDDAVIKMSVKDLKEWLEDYHQQQILKTTNNKQS
jgi:hypothetical protein